MTPFLLIAFGLLGLAVGSFLNVVIYRVPLGESVVRPGSKCPSCETEIRARDNIPIVSWLVLRARCRECRAEISPRYPIVETVTGLLWVACALRFDTVEEAAFVAVFGSVFLSLSAIDLDVHRLPNVIVLPSIVAAAVWVVGYAVATGAWGTAATAFAGGAGIFAVLFVIAFVSGGMGFGDVKLGALTGLVAGRFGWPVALGGLFFGFFVGGFVSVGLIVAGRKGRKDAIPFGPALAAGAVIALFVGDPAFRGWIFP
jgi:leader peptidase (prepilin peptidase) / N-methyltransferase